MVMDGKGLGLILELTKDQIKQIGTRFGLDLSQPTSDNRKLCLALEHLCDYGYFRLEKVGNSIEITFLK